MAEENKDKSKSDSDRLRDLKKTQEEHRDKLKQSNEAIIRSQREQEKRDRKNE